MFNTNLFQIIICILLIFLLFGDFTKFQENTKWIKLIANKYLKKKNKQEE